MADFGASGLLTLAKARYGEAILRGRMRGAGGVAADADAELLEIAAGVVERVKVAAVQVGWPLPGSDPDGTPWAEAWPKNLLQNALDLFNWRTLSGLESAADNQRRVGTAAEEFFEKVQSGGISLGVGGPTDTARPAPVSARSRDGSMLVSGGGSDRSNVLDTFRGAGWDYFS